MRRPIWDCPTPEITARLRERDGEASEHLAASDVDQLSEILAHRVVWCLLFLGTVRDLTGKTVLPGLVMVHEHLFYSSITKGPFHINEMEFSFPRLYLAAGVKFMEKDYRQDPKRDADNLALTLGPIYSWGANRLTARLGYEREDARNGPPGVEIDEQS